MQALTLESNPQLLLETKQPVVMATELPDMNVIAKQMQAFADSLDVPRLRVAVRLQKGHVLTQQGTAYGELVYFPHRETNQWIVPFQSTPAVYRALRLYRWQELEKREFWFRGLHQLQAASLFVVHQRSLTQPLKLDVRHKVTFEITEVNPHPRLNVIISTINAGGDEAPFYSLYFTSYCEHGHHFLPECRQKGEYGSTIFTHEHPAWSPDPTRYVHDYVAFKGAAARPAHCKLTNIPKNKTAPDPQLRHLYADFTQGTSTSNCPVSYCIEFSDRVKYARGWTCMNTGKLMWPEPYWPTALAPSWFADACRAVARVEGTFHVWRGVPPKCKLVAQETVYSVQFHSRHVTEYMTRLMSGTHTMNDVLQTVVVTYNAHDDCFRVYKSSGPDLKTTTGNPDHLWVDLVHCETSKKLSESPRAGKKPVIPLPVDPEKATFEPGRFISLHFELCESAYAQHPTDGGASGTDDDEYEYEHDEKMDTA